MRTEKAELSERRMERRVSQIRIAFLAHYLHLTPIPFFHPLYRTRIVRVVLRLLQDVFLVVFIVR